MKTNNMTLEQRIEAYFDCALSEAEEKELRRELAFTTEDSPIVNEAKAVMGMFAVARSKKRKTQRRGIVRYAAAAAVALVIGFGALTQLNIQPEEHLCVMYQDGKTISDPNLVMAQMESELACISLANDDINASIEQELMGMGSVLN